MKKELSTMRVMNASCPWSPNFLRGLLLCMTYLRYLPAYSIPGYLGRPTLFSSAPNKAENCPICLQVQQGSLLALQLIALQSESVKHLGRSTRRCIFTKAKHYRKHYIQRPLLVVLPSSRYYKCKFPDFSGWNKKNTVPLHSLPASTSPFFSPRGREGREITRAIIFIAIQAYKHT